MSTINSLRSAALVLLLLYGAGCQAGMYRWTDETGQTVYSQTPPPSGAAIKIRKDPPPNPADVERARRESREEVERSHDQALEREQTKSDQAEEEVVREGRAANCEAARHNLYTIENLGRRRVRTAEGDYRILPEDEREAQIREARAQIEEYCD